ncbi:hypothetical protein C5167_024327 [Papaver somniferum]|uniref:mitogen-activated protein kinase kinase kinase n=1 Tax=Papaver somniferum TaxID=3469 RepID=A0A4Y7JS36_PAPSO|nr:mitogen-activated protein kinase kinase kinase 1-like [Papaver somniferum]RZC62559.1 hypothetical protein C5167_024327 [Papaver somniferum]
MNHLSRFLGQNSSNKMDRKHRQQKQQRKVTPRLDRTIAKKYSNDDDEYDAGERGRGASTSFSSSLSAEEDYSSILKTRSLDIPPSCYPDRSFRIEGSDGGEIDRICLSLGLSGPEDFAISPSDWKESRANSSSDLNSNHFYRNDSLVSNRISSSNSIDDKLEINKVDVVVDDVVNSEFQARVRVTDDAICSSSTVITPGSSSSDAAVAVIVNGGGGIKGVRPPLLAPPPFLTPPPSLSRPVLDNSGSTWDLISSFAPDDYNSLKRGSSLEANSLDEDEHEEVEIDRTVIDRDEDGPRLGETDSSSFTTSNDEDSSSTSTEQNTISPNGRFRRNIRTWTKCTFLGSGSYGTVYEGFSDDGFFFAVKEVSLLDQGNQGKQSVYQLEQEIALLSNFEHENIVQYLGTDKAEGKLYIFLELVAKGSLAQLYQKYDLRDSQVSSYTRQILHGLKYLHDRDVVHRDIKCANILVDANGSVKLADFGLAKTTRLNDVKSSKGTAFWMAPEVVNRKNTGYGLPADIWSLGCTVLEMLTHQLPYAPLEWMQATYRIGKGEPPSVPENLSPDARDFILNCLRVKPEDRPTAATLLDHPFVRRSLPSSSGSDSPFHSRWR